MSARKVLCPFHSEQTPSCVIYAELMYYRCFGCGRHGHISELPDSELAELEVSDFIPKPKENMAEKMTYIKGLPIQIHRGLPFHTNGSGFYIVWPDNSYYLKRFTNGSEPKYVGPSGHDRPLFRAKAVRSSTLVLVEGELNALSIAKCIDANIVSVGGVGNFTHKRLNKHLYEFNRYEKIVILLDDDPAGTLGAIEASAYFKSLNKDVVVCLLKQDMNAVMTNEGQEQVAIQMAKCIG